MCRAVLYLLQLLRRRRLVVVIFFAPPAKRQVDNNAWLFNLIKRTQSLIHDRPLLLNVARFTKRVAEGPTQKDGAWRLNLFRIFSNDRNPDCGDPDFFNFSLYQSHGLIADASGRGQKNQIDLIGFEFACDLPGGFFDQRHDVPTIDMPHEGIMGCCQTADHPFVDQFI